MKETDDEEIDMTHEMDKLRSILTIIDDQRTRKRETVRDVLKATPPPLPDDLIDALLTLNPNDARSVLRDHPGCDLHERLASYDTARAVFDHAIMDLLKAIALFEEVARDPTIFDAVRKGELSALQTGVQKELFAAANAAASLRDHTAYRLQKKLQIAGYDQKRTECFGDDGLHDFVIALRVLLHHVRVIHAGWHVTHRFDGSDGDAVFKLDKTELLHTIVSTEHDMNVTARSYLERAPNRIDLGEIFRDYRDRATTFHSWFRTAIEASPLPELRDYQRCRQSVHNNATRLFWRAMLGNWLRWDKPPNPYDHLPKYLTPEQMEEVYRLPMKSRAQVDKIIAIGDKDGACDDELRDMFYELFDRATPPEGRS